MANPFAVIEKFITEHRNASFLREHVALIKARMEALEKEMLQLKEKIRQMETTNSQVNNLIDQADKGEFETYRDLLWKRDGVGYESSPYCPKCKLPLRQWPPIPSTNLHWACTDKCGLIVDWVAAPTA